MPNLKSPNYAGSVVHKYSSNILVSDRMQNQNSENDSKFMSSNLPEFMTKYRFEGNNEIHNKSQSNFRFYFQFNLLYKLIFKTYKKWFMLYYKSKNLIIVGFIFQLKLNTKYSEQLKDRLLSSYSNRTWLLCESKQSKWAEANAQ